jgi:biofilm protein TabA
MKLPWVKLKNDNMKNRILTCAFLIAAFSLITLNIYSQMVKSDTWTKEKAAQWMKNGAWKNAVSIKPHSSINPQEFAGQYHKNQELWDKAFLFLSRNDLGALAPGTYPIAGDDLYATISEYVPKDFEESGWESHRRYIDLQSMITGKEKIGVASVSKAKLTEAYDEVKDIAHYETPGKYYLARPGDFFLFFPEDAHRPSIKYEGNATVRKLVIKIRVTK